MRTGLALLLALGASVALAGCFGEKSSPVDVVPYFDVHEAGPGRTVQVPLFLNSTYSFKQDFGVRVELPDGWTYRLPSTDIQIAGFRGLLYVFDVTVPGDASPGQRTFNAFVGDTRAEVKVQVRDAQAGVEAGRGLNLTWMHVASNGTILAHHEPALKEREGLEYGPDVRADAAPLRVYLGAADGKGVPEPWRSAGFVRLDRGSEDRLLAAKVGEALVLPAGAPGEPLGAAVDGHHLVARIVGVLDAPEPP